MGLSRRGDVWWIEFTTPHGERIRRSAGTDNETRAREYFDRLKVQY
jgi:hypothetical protein